MMGGFGSVRHFSGPVWDLLGLDVEMYGLWMWVFDPKGWVSLVFEDTRFCGFSRDINRKTPCQDDCVSSSETEESRGGFSLYLLNRN